MTTANQDVWTNIKSKLTTLGYQNAVIGEPRAGMDSGLIAIIPMEGEIDELTLNSPREIHRLMLRMYVAWLDAAETTEGTLDAFRASIESDICGDFDLGGKAAYALPAEFRWSYDERFVQNGSEYRTVSLTIAYRLDDKAAFGK